MADASETIRIADKTTVTQQLAVDSDGKIGVSSIGGTGASDLGKAEDAAHASGDVGVQMLAVRTATPTNRSGPDGDYEPLQVNAGRLWSKTTIDDTDIDDYEAVAASSTGVLGATGAVGDFLARLLIVPGSTTGSIGTVSVRDGSTATAMNVFVASTLADGLSFNIELGAKSTIGAWNVLVGANVSVVAFGKFT